MVIFELLKTITPRESRIFYFFFNPKKKKKLFHNVILKITEKEPTSRLSFCSATVLIICVYFAVIRQVLELEETICVFFSSDRSRSEWSLPSDGLVEETREC